MDDRNQFYLTVFIVASLICLTAGECLFYSFRFKAGVPLLDIETGPEAPHFSDTDFTGNSSRRIWLRPYFRCMDHSKHESTLPLLVTPADSYSRDYAGDGCVQTRRGCKIDGGQCICGVGCYTEYRYNTKAECYKAIKSRESDLCQRNPCRNGGTCSQTTHDPGFKCRCEGTGFYGQRCQYACPKLGVPIQGAFPYECIVI
ncbi:hypothetical protein RUM43_003318 [Polyplax serrata]|uniref:EGF-like domain-containing protein n=1 Tax=Polyplax serrata TaxID=468196 RepID=A0AAN8PH82_POLSC